MRRIRLLAFLAIAHVPAAVIAQCATTLAAESPIPTVSGFVRATIAFDPDGTGPEPAWLIVGGGNLTAGDEAFRQILAHDGSRFRSVGFPSAFGIVRAFAIFNGELIAAGDFAFATTAGPVANNLARWDGTTWRHLGSGANGTVQALTVFNGELVAGGSFTNVGGSPGTLGIARWNGTAWSAFGIGWTGFGGVTTPGVRALAVFQGSLYAGGSFQAQGPVPQPRHLARWNGTNWGLAGDPDQLVNALAVRNGVSVTSAFLYATGAFATIGGVAATRVAAMDAVSFAWSAMPGGFANNGEALLVRSTGSFTFEVLLALGGTVLRWNGSNWTSAANVVGTRSIAVHAGHYVFGTDGSGQPGLLRMPFAGSAPTPVQGPGIQGAVHALALAGNDLIVGGDFTTVDGLVCNGIARRTGSTWSSFGTGVSGGAATVRAVAVLANGDVIVGGSFTTAGGVPARNVARWSGGTWSAIGDGFDDEVLDVLVLPNGELIAAGEFTASGATLCRGVARLVGSAWAAMTGLFGPIHGLAAMPNGDVVACGRLQGAPIVTGVARWNGSWTQLGPDFTGTPLVLAVEPNGDVVAGGDFFGPVGQLMEGVARWDGGVWQDVGGNVLGPTGVGQTAVTALVRLPTGGLLIGGSFSTQNGAPANRLARFEGGTWTAVAGGCNDDVLAAVATPAGTVYVGGAFRIAGGVGAGGLASLATTCPAAIAVHGAGCVGASGPMALAATELPWTGGTFRATSSTFGALSLALSVFGFQTAATPLSLVLPQAHPGCVLLTSPDAIAALVPTGFTVNTQLAIPAVPSLAGVQIVHQVVALEFSPAGAMTGVASTNALVSTVGSF